jgi:Flp pilus assembly protein TadG
MKKNLTKEAAGQLLAPPARLSVRPLSQVRSSGSVMLEFVLAFPVILTLMLACMQFSHIWMAKQVVHYAAFCAARATLVCEKQERQKAAKQAAEQVCAWIAEGTTGGEADKRIPGWGEIPGSGGVARKTKVEIEDEGKWNVKATVEHDFGLIFPIIGPMIGWLVNPWESGNEWTEQRADETGNVGDADLIRQAHIRFKEVVVLPKPYVTLPVMGLPASGW